MNFSSVSEDSWESAAYIGFAIVIFGVALEIIDLVIKWKKDHRNESILIKDVWWLWWIEAASVILVVLGLGLEFGAGLKATLIARQKIADLTAEAKASFDEAKVAENDAGESKLLAANIGITNAQLVLTNLMLAETIEELRSNNIALEAQLDDSIKSRIEVEMALFPRTFEYDSQLTNFSGTKFAITIAAKKNDDEDADFFNKLSETLHNVGWIETSPIELDPNDGVTISVRTGFGQAAYEHNPKSWIPLNAARALTGALRNNHIMVKLIVVNVHDGRPPPDTVNIVIGKKPDLQEIRERSFLFNDECM
jgi:hypothetical protein